MKNENGAEALYRATVYDREKPLYSATGSLMEMAKWAEEMQHECGECCVEIERMGA